MICFRPSPDRCSDENSSFLMELNAFTGGSIPEIIFDLNGDGVINEADTVFAGYDAEGNPVWISPSGIKFPGHLQPPISLGLNDLIELIFLNASTGVVQMLKEPSDKLGVIYWKELEQ